MSSYRDEFDIAFAESAAAHARLLRSVARLAETEAWRGDGAADLTSWICARKQVSRRTARALVREAEALKERPALGEALARGEISVDQCNAIATLSAEDSDEAEQWLEALPFWSYHELEREARKAKARELERRDDGVYLRTSHTPDERYLRGEFQLHPEDGAIFLASIDARIPDGTKLRDYDGAAARALVEMASEPITRKPSVVPTFLVAADDVAVKAWSRSVVAVGVGRRTGFVSEKTAQRLACDGRTQKVIKDEHGRITHTGHASRDVPPATRRAVFARDHGMCTFPGCDRDRYLQVHHIVYDPDGRTHDMDNLLLVCWTHHDLVHVSGWSLRGDAGRHITWVKPDGTPFEPLVRVVLDTS